jgi:23S rRNA pseudouridine955/2504/2580 synthase
MNGLRKDAPTLLTVDEAGAGQRVDNYLLRLLKGVPKSHVYRILRSGEVRLNKGRVTPDRRLAPGDVLRVPPVRAARPAPGAAGASGASLGVAPAARPFTVPILYEDDAFLALDKPAGLAVHGGSGIAHGVIEQLRAARPQVRMLELVHRLDRDTSGLLLVAKQRAALLALHAALRDGEVDKRYWVLVGGRWRDAMRRVRVPLHKFSTRDGERRVRVDAHLGREAETVFRRIAGWPAHEPPLTLLEAELLTGRTHQIRVHLQHVGVALAGDDKYGDFAWNRTLQSEGLRRMFLHAHRLALRHPLTGEAMVLQAALPVELARYLGQLGVPAVGGIDDVTGRAKLPATADSPGETSLQAPTERPSLSGGDGMRPVSRDRRATRRPLQR